MKIYVCLALLLALAMSTVAYAGNGVDMGSAEGLFIYRDDFTTTKFMQDSFPINMGLAQWRAGAIFNKGPDSGRTLVYRFYSTRQLIDFSVTVNQLSNLIHLGGSVSLYYSNNGMDWLLAASSRDQEADANGWQALPLTYKSSLAKIFSLGTEVWIKLVMDNTSGLSTGEASVVSGLEVRVNKSATEHVSFDPNIANKATFEKLSKANSAVFTAAKRDKCCLEDLDGSIVGIHERFFKWESRSIFSARQYVQGKRIPLACILYVQTKKSSKPVYAAITLLCASDASRKVSVRWNGKTVGKIDSGRFISQNITFYIPLSESTESRVNSLRIGGEDSGSVRLVKCEFAADKSISIVERPAVPKANKLTVLDAYYMPDSAPPKDSQAVEGRTIAGSSPLVFAALQRMYSEHEDFGAIRVVVKNSGKQTVYIGNGIGLNGRPVDSHYVDFRRSDWDARGVVWYRMRPSVLKSGECGQLYIRFRKRPAGNVATVTISPKNSPSLKVHIPYARKLVSIDYVTADKNLQNLYIYLRQNNSSPAKVTGVRVNDVAVESNQIVSTGNYGDITALRVKAPENLVIGRYYTVQVSLSDKSSTAVQFRVLPFWFPKSSYHVPPEVCNKVGMNLTMQTLRPLEDCLKYDIYTNSFDVFQGHERTRLVLGPDEPDAKDNAGGGYDRGLGWNARQLAHSGWQELITRFVPQTASWLMMDGTTRPLNWAVYAQLADICAFDPYPVTFYGADHAYVGESLNLARSCGAPNRMYACLEAYGWGSGQGVPAGARGPSTEEYRQNVVQAIGAGAKGLTSWVYVASAGGWQNRTDFKAEILRCNKLIQNIEDLLIIGTPVNGVASSDAGLVMTGTVGNELWEKDRVKVSCLICGTQDLIVTVANHIPASKSEPAIPPAENVKITVKLPTEFHDVKVYEVSENGLSAVEAQVTDHNAVIAISKLVSGKVFVIRSER